MKTRDILIFKISHNVVVNVQARKEAMEQWADELNLEARCLGVFVSQGNYSVGIRWMVPNDREKTMFKLKWK